MVYYQSTWLFRTALLKVAKHMDARSDQVELPPRLNFQACTYSTVVGAVTITWSYLRSSTVRKFTPYILTYILRAPHQARRCEKQGWKQRNILGTISPTCSTFFWNSIQGGIAKWYNSIACRRKRIFRWGSTLSWISFKANLRRFWRPKKSVLDKSQSFIVPIDFFWSMFKLRMIQIAGLEGLAFLEPLKLWGYPLPTCVLALLDKPHWRISSYGHWQSFLAPRVVCLSRQSMFNQ